MDSLSVAVSLGALLQKYEADIARWISNRALAFSNRKHFTDEVLQETRIRIWKRYAAFNADVMPERAWVYCQTRDAFIEFCRREQRWRSRNVNVGQFNSWTDAVGESRIVQSVTGLLTKLAKQDAAARAVELLQRLEPRDRENITMHDMDGLTFREIAAVEATAAQREGAQTDSIPKDPEATARKRHYDAIRRFRDLWNCEFPDAKIGGV